MPNADIITYFLSRLSHLKLIAINVPLDLQYVLQTRGYSVQNVSYVDTQDAELVIAHNLSRLLGSQKAKQVYNEISERAQIMLVWDEEVVFAGPQLGWLVGTSKDAWCPFGLKLPFSLFDRKLAEYKMRDTESEVLAIISCYNEVDIIEQTISNLIQQGIGVHIFDNWSNDGTWEILKSMEENGSIKLERFPVDGPSPSFNLSNLLSHTETVASGHQGKWIIHMDADEVRRSPWPDLSFKQALALVESYGANAVDFTVVNFRPIDNRWTRGDDPELSFAYCEFGSRRDAYTRQIKMWKQGSHAVSLAESAGHEVRFIGRNLFPYKFILKHYPIRSNEHGAKKLLADRLPRFDAKERQMGWHTHYDHLSEEKGYLYNEEDLILFRPAQDGNVGVAVITGLAPNDQLPENFKIAEAAVYVPVDAVVVLDLPDDRVAALPAAAAFRFLIGKLRTNFRSVCAIATTDASEQFAKALDLPVERMDYRALIDGQINCASKSYALAELLRSKPPEIVISTEAGGITAAALMLRETGLEFNSTTFVCISSGRTKERLSDEGLELYIQEHIEADFLESKVLSKSDFVIRLSDSSLRQFEAGGEKRDQEVLFPLTATEVEGGAEHARIEKIAFYGPLTGSDFENYLKCLPAIVSKFPNIQLYFIGPFGWIYGEHAGGYLVRLAKRIGTNFFLFRDRTGAFASPAEAENTLFVVPKYAGFSAFAYAELADDGLPILISDRAFLAGRSVKPTYATTDFSYNDLADKLIEICNKGIATYKPPPNKIGDFTVNEVSIWAASLYGHVLRRREHRELKDQIAPNVAVVIPHFERPELLIECINGFQKQTYTNFSIIVVDDGSRGADIRVILEELSRAFSKMNVRIVYQKNAYLGAARNTGFNASSADYVLFFDDDDYPLPDYIESLVKAAQTTKADIITTSLQFWHGGAVEAREQMVKASHFPVGASVAAAFGRNSLGSAAVMVRRSTFSQLELYTTDYGLGWEDYEFAFRGVATGAKFVLIPKPLYLYRVNTSGMSSMTPTIANGRRLWRTVDTVMGAAEMKEVMKATFFARIWEEDKNNKWAWLHSLGEATPLYHRLIMEPFNSCETYSLLAELCSREGLPEMADQVATFSRSPLSRTSTTSVFQEGQKAQSASDLKRLFSCARALLRMEKHEAASRLFEVVVRAGGPEKVPSLLGLCWIQIKDGRYDEAFSTLSNILELEPNCVEAHYAFLQLCRLFKDDVLQDAARQIFEESLAESYRRNHQTEYPSLMGLSTDDALLHWTTVGKSDNKRLTNFSFFNDSCAEELEQRFGRWERLGFVELATPDSEREYSSFDFERQVLVTHPPVSEEPTMVALKLPEPIHGIRLLFHVETPDPRSVPVEVSVSVIDNYESIQARFSEFATGSLVAHDIFKNSDWVVTCGLAAGKPTFANLPSSSKFDALLFACRNARRDSDNSYATTYIRSVYCRVDGLR